MRQCPVCSLLVLLLGVSLQSARIRIPRICYGVLGSLLGWCSGNPEVDVGYVDVAFAYHGGGRDFHVGGRLDHRGRRPRCLHGR